jgi:hypothetical protein
VKGMVGGMEECAELVDPASGSPLIVNVGGGGVASRTGRPVCCGTCRERRPGLLPPALCGGGGGISSGVAGTASGPGDSEERESLLLIIADLDASVALLAAGGRPRGLPPVGVAEGHALDTAGPCFRLLFPVEGVIAELGSPSNAASIRAIIDPPPGIALAGCGVAGVTAEPGTCHRRCDMDGVIAECDAASAALGQCWKACCVDTAVHGSCIPPTASGCADMGIAERG